MQSWILVRPRITFFLPQFFFCQAEDGIRDGHVTGVQTCALPIYNKEVVTYLKAYLSEDGVICSMQNGLPELLISEIIGDERVFGCTMNWSAFMEGSGVVHLASKNTPKTLSFGLGSFHQEKRVHLEEIKRLLSQMRYVTLEENLMGVRWSKLLINSSFNGLSAILV